MTLAPPMAAPPTGSPPGAEFAVATAALSKQFGPLWAVRDLNLRVPRGAVFGLIGPNGAGKSTTFAMLASLLAPTWGGAWINGASVTDNPRAVRASMGYMPDVLGVYDNLQVEEYLRFFAAAYNVPSAGWPALVDGLLDLVELKVKRDAMVNSLSRGMKQRLSLARALIHDPEVLILDEPASGLDPRARVELRLLLGELQAMGKTIVISSHILAELEEMCSHVAIMEAGALLVAGEPKDIRAQLSQGRTVTVRLAGGETRQFTVADDAEQAALLRRLIVEEGLDVVECTESRAGLEQMFMEVTEGIVQ